MPPSLPNPARAALEAGRLSLGFTVRLVRSVEIAPATAASGYDWLFLDCEHGTIGLDAAAQITVAGLGAGIAPIVRIPNGHYAMATRMLDSGALGIVVPHVDTADEAREVVEKLKYPPVGHRSMGGIGPHYALRTLGVGEAAAVLNAAILIVVMLETPRAIENAEAIAAVPGIDVLLIGSNDLCAEMGIPGQFTHPRLEDAYRRAIAACRAHGKHPGMGGIYAEAIMASYVALGARFILAGQDSAFMLAAATAREAALRAMPLG